MADLEDADELERDECGEPTDPHFRIDGIAVRRVEPRKSPTMINAVFNHRNFWDGRANNIFNGINPFGERGLLPTSGNLNPGTLVRDTNGDRSHPIWSWGSRRCLDGGLGISSDGRIAGLPSVVAAPFECSTTAPSYHLVDAAGQCRLEQLYFAAVLAETLADEAAPAPSASVSASTAAKYNCSNRHCPAASTKW